MINAEWIIALIIADYGVNIAAGLIGFALGFFIGRWTKR
jgi:hypothetical protein